MLAKAETVTFKSSLPALVHVDCEHRFCAATDVRKGVDGTECRACHERNINKQLRESLGWDGKPTHESDEE